MSSKTQGSFLKTNKKTKSPQHPLFSWHLELKSNGEKIRRGIFFQEINKRALHIEHEIPFSQKKE